MNLHDHSKVIISRQSYDFDGHRAHSVTERATGRLVGHVARTRNAAYGRRYGSWCYLHVSMERGAWYLAGWTCTDAVDHLLSADAPSAAFLADGAA